MGKRSKVKTNMITRAQLLLRTTQTVVLLLTMDHENINRDPITPNLDINEANDLLDVDNPTINTNHHMHSEIMRKHIKAIQKELQR